MNSLNKIYASKVMYALVGVSTLYFLTKGVSYAFIGSFFPIVFISALLMILYWSFISNQKTHRRVVRIWAILLLIWALARLSLWLILKIDHSLTESHIRDQFGMANNLVSILMLTIGFGIIRQLKRSKLPPGEPTRHSSENTI